MRNILRSAWVVLIIAALAFSSCQKKKEDKISETWRLIRVSVDSTVTWYELWQMDDGYITMLKRDDSTGNLDTLGTGTYTVDAGLSKTMITMEGMSDNTTQYVGDWEVLKLNDDILVILHEEGGWYYREFVIE
ncbi:MAG: hypothetical protein JXR53_03470 [Bacteroidales bacterium]|nr:hypothetical protein [Bacteroidales bacterium]